MSRHNRPPVKRCLEFQSLFYWNTSDEQMITICTHSYRLGFNPCSIGIPLMSRLPSTECAQGIVFQSLFYWNTSDEWDLK